jgi:hypothetical protein
VVIAHMKPIRNEYKVLFGNPEGERPLGISRCTWDGNVQMALKFTECDCVDTVMNLTIVFCKGWEFCDYVSDCQFTSVELVSSKLVSFH